MASPVRVALAGAGQFGVTLAAAIRDCPEVTLSAVADLDVERARAVLALAGTPADSAAHATDDAASLHDLDVDVLVEATGDPASGAALAADAIDRGRHVIMVSKEVESVVGPVLAARARERGVVYAMVEGDQPSLLVALIERARRMGLEVVAAGKSTEYDVVWSSSQDTVSSQGRTVAAPDLATLWQLGDDYTTTLAARAERVQDLPGRSAADLCEMLVVANAIEMLPASTELHAPLLRTVEVPEVFRALADGGLLEARGRLTLFQCLRREDEAGFAGGVFVVVAWPEGETARVLTGKGMPSSADGRFGMLHNPVHLLGVECLISILEAARAHRATGQARRPVVDLAARARRDFAPGERLRMGGHFHEIEGADARLLPAAAIVDGSPLPYHLASNATVARPIARGELVRVGDVVEPPGSAVWRLRREQDRMYLC